jgi:hypothetical protein
MIQTDPEDLGRIRERIRKMSDLELRECGRRQRPIRPKEKLRASNPAFQIQLDEARAEWRRRHPRSSGQLTSKEK